MPINYGLDGTQAVNWHYKTRLISSYQNKLFQNIFTTGVIPESGIPITVDVDYNTSTQGTQVKIPAGFSFLISPNNRYEGGVIQENFEALSTLEQQILEQQILKCDIVKDFCVVPSSSGGGWLIAKYNYLEFSDLPVEFSIVSSKPINNSIILGKVIPSGAYLQEVNFNDQEVAELNPVILYEMNVYRIDGYQAGNESGYVPISNGMMCSGLNAEMINGYSGNEVAVKWEQNSGLNIQYVADEFGIFYQPGNAVKNIPLSNKTLNVGLNAEFVGGSGYMSFSRSNHQHNLDDIQDMNSVFKRPVGVNVDHHLTHDSFKTRAITREKIGDECFFARNDDRGGPPLIITGETTVTANYTHIPFNPENQLYFAFDDPPDVMLQIIDRTPTYDDRHYIKVEAVDVHPSHFTLKYTGYSGLDTEQYTSMAISTLTVQWLAVGYYSGSAF
jgi:hypothetical protein